MYWWQRYLVASTNLVTLSKQVSIYQAGDVYTPSYQRVGGSEPVMSMCTDGRENSVVYVLVCLEILCCWHS